MYTGLEIEVIEPARSDTEMIEDFLALGPEMTAKPDRGSTLAWLGHLAVLQNMVASGVATALIVEDDVDFDIMIKSQMRKLATAVQHFTNTSHENFPYVTGPPGAVPRLERDFIQYHSRRTPAYPVGVGTNMYVCICCHIGWSQEDTGSCQQGSNHGI
jgi:hypothetical protein